MSAVPGVAVDAGAILVFHLRDVFWRHGRRPCLVRSVAQTFSLPNAASDEVAAGRSLPSRVLATFTESG